MPKNLAQRSISNQFLALAEKVGLTAKQYNSIMETILSDPNEVQNLIRASFLDERVKRQYVHNNLIRLCNPFAFAKAFTKSTMVFLSVISEIC